MKIANIFILVVLVFSMFVSACTSNGLLIVDSADSDVYYENLLSNETSYGLPGDGVLWEYLDVAGSENRTFFEIIGDDKQ